MEYDEEYKKENWIKPQEKSQSQKYKILAIFSHIFHWFFAWRAPFLWEWERGRERWREREAFLFCFVNVWQWNGSLALSRLHLPTVPVWIILFIFCLFLYFVHTIRFAAFQSRGVSNCHTPTQRERAVAQFPLSHILTSPQLFFRLCLVLRIRISCSRCPLSASRCQPKKIKYCCHNKKLTSKKRN